MEIKWRNIIIGLLLIFILTFFSFYLGYLIFYFVASVYVGYAVNKDYKNGAVHGGLVSAIAVLISALIVIIALGGTNKTVLQVLILQLILCIIIGIIGGIIGSTVRKEEINKD